MKVVVGSSSGSGSGGSSRQQQMKKEAHQRLNPHTHTGKQGKLCSQIPCYPTSKRRNKARKKT